MSFMTLYLNATRLDHMYAEHKGRAQAQTCWEAIDFPSSSIDYLLANVQAQTDSLIVD